MRLSRKKAFIGAAAILISAAFGYQIFSIKKSATATLAQTRARLLEDNRVPFETKILMPHLSDQIRIWQNTAETRDLTRFQNSYFAATSGGLAQFADDGKLIGHFTVTDGLPDSDLTCLRVWRGRLFIGTRTNNLIAFDGAKFTQFNWTDRQAQAVTAILERGDKLLVGTFGGGLLEYDGDFFTEIRAADKRISAVNCLFADGATLYVGTFANGLWTDENDVWTHFTVAENLPSNRVVGIAAQNKKIYVATDFGLALLEDKTLHALAVAPALSGLAAFDDRIFTIKDDGEVFTFDKSLKRFRAAENLQKARLIGDGETLWLVSSQGISRLSDGVFKTFSQPEKNLLSDNFISALAFDDRENLWVGFFRRGVDVFAADGRKLKHLESDATREINFLQANDATVSAATAGGRQIFKANFTVENQTSKNGLPSDSVTHFSGEYTATTRGLAFRETGKMRVLSTVQGLPNNAVYTTLQTGGKLYAGTLGGLAEIEGNRIVRTFKDSNSNLQTNWITALTKAGERIFIGTYGGGVFELLPSGEIHSFDGETGKFVVNPNALFTDGERLYAGTLNGVAVLNLETQEWKTYREFLPAETVLSITGDRGNIFFGTTNGIAQIKKSYFENGTAK